MANSFVYTNPEAAKQAIAQLQLQAALAENESRQAIERERTSAAKYATQAQINENEKDRAVRREDIASRAGYRTGEAADKRGNIQYRTILDSFSATDPPTKSELEAMIAANPQLSDDLKNNLRSERDKAYKDAKANAAMGERMAKNYRTELDANAKDSTKLEAIYLRMARDANVIFDRATGSVESAFKMPREDGVAGAAAGGSVGISPAQDYGGASVSQINRSAGAGAGIPTIGDIRARITGDISGIGNAAPIASAPPVTSSDLKEPAQSIGPFGIPTFTGIGRGIVNAVQSIPMNPYGGLELFQQGASPRIPRGLEMAQPPPAGPPSFSSPFGAIDQTMRATMPPAPTAFDMMPRANQQSDDLMNLIRFVQHPNFRLLPAMEQQSVLDELGMLQQRMPSMSDIQTIRPEFRPPLQ